MAAIAAHHSTVGDQSIGKNPLAIQFLRGIRRLRPPVRPRMPTSDLAVVLEALSKAPFVPLEEVPLRFLTAKTVFILAISSLKRVGDLQASPHCWGSELISLGAWRPLRPFHLAHRCKIFVTLRDGPPVWHSSGSIASTFKPLPAPQFSLPRLVPCTLGRDLSEWWRGHIVPKAFDAARSSRKGTSQVTYVTLVPWGNEMLSRRPYFLHHCGRLLHLKLPPPSWQVLF